MFKILALPNSRTAQRIREEFAYLKKIIIEAESINNKLDDGERTGRSFRQVSVDDDGVVTFKEEPWADFVEFTTNAITYGISNFQRHASTVIYNLTFLEDLTEFRDAQLEGLDDLQRRFSNSMIEFRQSLTQKGWGSYFSELPTFRAKTFSDPTHGPLSQIVLSEHS